MAYAKLRGDIVRDWREPVRIGGDGSMEWVVASELPEAGGADSGVVDGKVTGP